jgi:hypothetical protein
MNANQIDDNERTNATGLFNTARSYWRSAEHLNAARIKVTHPQAPVTFLFCHAIELYLKSYLRGTGADLAELKKLGHRVANLAKAAVASGLKLEPQQSEILSHVDDADVAIEARYIVTGFKSLPTNEALASAAEVLDQAVSAGLANLGVHVREEKFHRPDVQVEGELSDAATRVLVHLFTTHERQQREVGAMASKLALDRGVLEYHLDQLNEAKFAERAAINYRFGHVYWAITSEGRKYVVERKLNP